MASYTDINVTIDEVGVYSDSILSTLVEDLTSKVVNLSTGLYEVNEALDYNLYTLGQVYYLKVLYTPSGDTQRTQSYPFYVFPQSQPMAAASITDTDCRDSTHLQPPSLSLRIGRDAFREADLENFTEVANVRQGAVFPMPAQVTAFDHHMLIENSRAGAPFSLAGLFLYGFESDVRVGAGDEVERYVPLPTGGFRASSYAPDFLLKLSRNLDLSGDRPRRRRGYRILDTVSGITSGKEAIRIVMNRAAGTVEFAFLCGGTIYEDDLSTILQASLTDTYAAKANFPHRVLHIRGRTAITGNGSGDEHVLIHDGTNFLSRQRFTQPAKATLASDDTGNTVTAGTWQVRVRFYDEKTGTYSEPSDSESVVVTSGQRIQVTMPTAPSRASHWQVQLALTTDVPSNYEIHYQPRDNSDTLIAGVTTGLIPKATTTVYFTDDPASGDRFAYRTTGSVTIYRTARLPTGAYHMAHFQGHVFYASYEDTWLVWSETDNLEHTYADPTDPASGLSSIDGEALIDTITSPVTALAATEIALYIFMRNGIVMGTGTFAVQFNSAGELIGRDARFDVLGQNSNGAISPSTQVVDQDVYFFSPAGPAAVLNGGVFVLLPEAIADIWRCRDPEYENRYHIGYDAERRLVLFSFVSLDTPIAGYPDITLAWSSEKQTWFPPWDCICSSWTLQRYNDGVDDQTTRVFFGGPYGAMCEANYSNGDGEDGSDVDAGDLLSTSDTATSVTVSGKTWSTDEWKGKAVVLVDRGTGKRVPRIVKSNTATVLNFEGNVTDSGSGWKIHLGGIHGRYHVASFGNGREYRLNHVRATLFDLLSTDAG